MMNILAYAQRYRSVGIQVLPIRGDGSKAPDLREWKHLQERPMTDQELRASFSNGSGLAAIGGTISGNLEDFDFDHTQTFEEWKQLIIEHLGQQFWDTLLIVRTPRPGFAVITRCPAGVDASQKLAWALNPKFGKPDEPEFIATIETKGEGGYFLLPGCPTGCHVTGRTYDVIQGSFKRLPELTTEQREVLLSCARSFDQKPREEHKPQTPRPRVEGELSPGDAFNANGPDWYDILKPYGYRFHSSRGDATLWTRPGKEHGISATTNYAGSDLFYPFSTNCYPFDSGRGYNKFAAYAFLNHNGDFSAAAKELYRQGYGTRREKTKLAGAAIVETEEPAPTDGPSAVDSDSDFIGGETDEPRPTKYSDDALGDLFSARHEHDFLYVDSWGWLRWTGQRWQRVSDVVVMGYARQICRQQAELCKEDQDLSVKAREGLARALASAKVIAATVKLAATDPRHYREVSEFDTDLWLFNTPGGTIHLKTGELRPHQREDLITKIANATPKGECPKWLAFLDRVTNHNQDLQAYLQRLGGYAMCGDPMEECLDFFHGEGGNGKGTFLKTLQYIFGEYSTTAQTETFLETKGERHPTDIAKLAGARLVVAQEVDEGQHWNEVRLKTLTGRDEMTARFMRRDLFDFVPQFTLIISGNNKPALKTVDEAWRRRFHLVPFSVVIPPEERDENLKNVLREEADGIMAWVVAGCLEWQRQKLNPPEIVLAATAEYLEAEDVFEFWLAECCLRGHEGYEERISWAYTSHRHWKTERGENPPGTKTFSQRMKKHGFQVGQETSGQRAKVFREVRLTDDERLLVKAILDAQRRREQGGTEAKGDYFG